MYRAYHAIRGLTGPDGKSTNAVYGFATMLRKLIADHKPEYIAASFDLAGPTFRDEIAADYKANRAPMPSDLAEQVPLVREACEALGVPVLTSERFEADDVIGTLAMQAHAAGFDVAIVTGDKDFFQLVGDSIRVYNPRDEGTWFDAPGVVEKFGVRPDQVVDVLALMGDSIDNIKGVPGIGEKGARELIATHGTLDTLLGVRGGSAAEAVPRRPAGACGRRAGEPGAGEDPDRRAGGVRSGRASVHADRRARAATRCSRGSDSARSCRVRADRGDLGARDYQVARSLEEVDALANALARAKRFGLGVVAERRVVGQRRCRRLVVFVGARIGAVRAARALRPDRHAESSGPRGVRAARTGARRFRPSKRSATI